MVGPVSPHSGQQSCLIEDEDPVPPQTLSLVMVEEDMMDDEGHITQQSIIL
jgi:hypothetical protein